jgi:hypothetical protein
MPNGITHMLLTKKLQGSYLNHHMQDVLACVLDTKINKNGIQPFFNRKRLLGNVK